MRSVPVISRFRFAIALSLALWCAGAGCVLVSYARGAAMTTALFTNNQKQKGWGAITASAGSHDCCKARHRALQRDAGSKSANSQGEQVTLPESETESRSCCPLTSGTFVTAASAEFNNPNASVATLSDLPSYMTASTDHVRLDFPLHLPNESKAYLVDCAFLI